MKSFLIKISIMPPYSKTKLHPLSVQSEVVFKCFNDSLHDALKIILQHPVYEHFFDNNQLFGTFYIYYSYDNHHWKHYDEII